MHKNNQLCCFLSQEMYKAKRVCVIGAGPSGMSALYKFKQLEMKGQEIPEIVCFEKQSDWGGLWNYSWRTGRRLFCCIRITVENSLNPSPVYIRLCKYRKKVFYCFMNKLSREKKAKRFVVALIKIRYCHQSQTLVHDASVILFCKKEASKIPVFLIA